MNVTLNESTNCYHKCKIKYYFPAMKSNLALFYPIDYNCLCDPGFLVTNLGGKNDFKMTNAGFNLQQCSFLSEFH